MVRGIRTAKCKTVVFPIHRKMCHIGREAINLMSVWVEHHPNALRVVSWTN
jgi:hypothetical protein